jgi:hypothetical protein
LASCYELYILFLKRSSHAQQIPTAANPLSANDTSHRGSQQDLGPIDQLNNLPQKLHDLEWNVVAFAPVSSITLCASTILKVSAICFWCTPLGTIWQVQRMHKATQHQEQLEHLVQVDCTTTCKRQIQISVQMVKRETKW